MAAVLLLGLAALTPAAPLPAQAEPDDAGSDAASHPPTWAGDVAFVGGNALLGGLTAGLIRAGRGGEFWRAFRSGAIGGAVAYAGRRVAVERFSGAGLLGREVAALGASLVRNAGQGWGAFDRLVLPVGPLRLYVRTGAARAGEARVRVKLDLPTVVATAVLATHPDTELDLSASLSSGVPVFTTRVRGADGYWRGRQIAGAIRLEGNPEDPSPDAARVAVLAHERVHVLQYDFGLPAWSDPAEAWLFRRVPGGEWAERHVDLGLHLAPWALANWLLRYDQRPWEHEAHFLSGVRSER